MPSSVLSVGRRLPDGPWSCRFTLGSRSGSAEWSFDEPSLVLVVAPEGGSPLAYPVREMIGVAGDGYTLRLTIPGPRPGVTS